MDKYLTALMAVFLLLPSFASAQEGGSLRVQILDFHSVDGDDDFSRGLSVAVRMAAMSHEEWSVSDRSITLAQIALSNSEGCTTSVPVPVPVACYVQLAESLDTDVIITGIISRSSGSEDDFEYIVNLDVFDARSGELAGQVSTQFPRVNTSNSDIAARFSRVLRQLMAQVDDSAEEEPVRLEGPDPNPTPATNDDGYQPTLFGHLGWVAVGLTVVSAGLMIGSMAHLNSLNEDDAYHAYRLRVPVRMNGVTLNACNEARTGSSWGATDEEVAHAASVCDEGDAWETAQYVFIGTTVVFGLAAGVLHLLDGLFQGMREMRGIAIAPSIGPDHGYLGVTGRF